MDDTFETIDLDMEESNELLFKVNVEGASSPARVRLVCEAEDISYMFDSNPTETPGVVQFVIPEMSNKLSAEGSCEARIEVLIENRYFTPVEFGINFKKAMKVFAEAVQLPTVRKQSPRVKVSASSIIVNPRRKRQQHDQPSGPQPASIAAPAQPQVGSLRERWLKNHSDDLDELVVNDLASSKKKKRNQR